MAQSGSAQRLGRWGRGFESLRPDQIRHAIEGNLAIAIVGGALVFRSMAPILLLSIGVIIAAPRAAIGVGYIQRKM